MRKLMKNTGMAAGFAALLLAGACASTNHNATVAEDEVVHVTQSASVAPSGEILVDADGNVYTSSATANTSMTSSSSVDTGTTTTRIVSTTAPVTTDVSMTSSSNFDAQETTSTTTTETRTRMRKD